MPNYQYALSFIHINSIMDHVSLVLEFFSVVLDFSLFCENWKYMYSIHCQWNFHCLIY